MLCLCTLVSCVCMGRFNQVKWARCGWPEFSSSMASHLIVTLCFTVLTCLINGNVYYSVPGPFKSDVAVSIVYPITCALVIFNLHPPSFIPFVPCFPILILPIISTTNPTLYTSTFTSPSCHMYVLLPPIFHALIPLISLITLLFPSPPPHLPPSGDTNELLRLLSWPCSLRRKKSSPGLFLGSDVSGRLVRAMERVQGCNFPPP